MGKPVDHVKNEVERLVAEYQLDDFDLEELGTYLTAKYNIKTWEKAIRTLRKQLDTAISFLSFEQYAVFLDEIRSAEFNNE